MERIGIAASKIAKGNLFLYNLCVILIAFLFSVFIFVIAGATVLFALIIIRYVSMEMMAYEFEKSFSLIFAQCMVALTIVISIFTLLALLRNMKFTHTKVKNGTKTD